MISNSIANELVEPLIYIGTRMMCARYIDKDKNNNKNKYPSSSTTIVVKKKEQKNEKKK